MPEVKQIDQSAVLAFYEPDLQLLHETADCEPKVVPHHHHALDSLPITVSKSFHQFSALSSSGGVEPLLELIKDDENLLPRRNASTSTKGRHALDKIEIVRQLRTAFPQSPE